MNEFFGSLSGTFGRATAYADEQPVRAEIYSVERLEQYAQTSLTPDIRHHQERARSIAAALEDNGRKLVAAYRTWLNLYGMAGQISGGWMWLIISTL